MLALRWFENNYMKLNTDKCHLIVPDCKYEQVWANIGKFQSPKIMMLNFFGLLLIVIF